MFCPSCSNLMMPSQGKMECSCGYIQEEGKISDRTKKKVDVQVMESKDTDVLPKAKYDCKSCNNNEAFFWTLQTRSADEPETKFYKCTKCGSVMREY